MQRIALDPRRATETTSRSRSWVGLISGFLADTAGALIATRDAGYAAQGRGQVATPKEHHVAESSNACRVVRDVLVGFRRLRQCRTGSGIPESRHRLTRRVTSIRANRADDGLRHWSHL